VRKPPAVSAKEKPATGRGRWRPPPSLTIDGDDITLDLRAATPAPHLKGRVTRVVIEKGKLVQFFDSSRRAAPLEPPFHSGTGHFDNARR
jgi:hypothetical protein